MDVLVIFWTVGSNVIGLFKIEVVCILGTKGVVGLKESISKVKLVSERGSKELLTVKYS